MAELVFEVTQELGRSVVEAVTAFYFDQEAPASVRLRLVKDEVLKVA